MQELRKKELCEINGGGWGIFAAIGSGVIFIFGIISGYVNPLKCN